MKITFRSDDMQELNFVREYEEGFSVNGPTGLTELKSAFDYNDVHSTAHRLYIPGVIASLFQATSAGYEYYIESDFPYLQMHFELSTAGCEYIPKAGFEPETRIYNGQHALLFYPSLKGALRYLPKTNGFSVEIEITLDFFRRLFHDDLMVLRNFGEQIEKLQPGLMGNRSFPITPRMKEVLFEIRSCNYVGTLKRMFIEAKVVELLTLQIDQISSGRDLPEVSLKKDDIDKLHHVRDIMLNNLVSPLSIEQLSRMAGLNRTKLQEGFKQVFGNTVFGYLTHARMAQAREIILDGKYASIAEVASLIGYKNPQHFTAAFKKTFGYLPKDIR